LAGPSMLGFINRPEHVNQFADLGVILLLFTIGIEFSLSQFSRLRRIALAGGFLQVGLTVLIVAVLEKLAGFSFQQAVFLGFLAAVSSTALVVKLLADRGEMDTPQAGAAFGIAIFQDLCVIPLMMFTPILAGGPADLTEISVIVAKAAAVLFGGYYAAKYAIPWALGKVVRARSRELFILSLIFIGFATAWLTSQAGLSLALGAFIAGLAISESEYSHQALGDMMPFREVFISVFFISVGMLFDPKLLLTDPFLAVAIALGLIIVKASATTGAALSIGLPARTSIMTGLFLAQIGEFSFVLAREGLSVGLIPDRVYQLFLAASIATMSLTPLMVRFAAPVADVVAGALPDRMKKGRLLQDQTKKGLELTDHVVIVGFGLNGKNVAHALKRVGIPFVIIESNPFTVKDESKKGENILFGDASRLEVLAEARIDRAKELVVAISDAASSRLIVSLARKMNPVIHIIVRTRYIIEMEPLHELGANEVIPEEFETSVEIVARVLNTFLLPQDQIERIVSEARSGGYEMFRAMGSKRSPASGLTGYLFGAQVAAFTVQEVSELVGRSIRGGTIRNGTGATVLAVRRGDDTIPNPDPSWVFKPGDVVLVIGKPEQVSAVRRMFKGE
ncbi:MAG TPA: cation:proton antiporter, partial [Nitrospirota bacterium]